MRVPSDFVGYLAALLVLLTFLSRDMTRLRLLAMLSNVAFIVYGIMASLPPVLLLHLLLLPVNVFRLTELRGVSARAATRVMLDLGRIRKGLTSYLDGLAGTGVGHHPP